MEVVPTIDVDVTVSVEPDDLSGTVRAITTHFRSPVGDAPDFVRQTRTASSLRACDPSSMSIFVRVGLHL
jgi:hypothetical protein